MTDLLNSGSQFKMSFRDISIQIYEGLYKNLFIVTIT